MAAVAAAADPVEAGLALSELDLLDSTNLPVLEASLNAQVSIG